MKLLITIFLFLPLFSIGQVDSEYKNISISEYYGIVGSTINKYFHHNTSSSTILRLTDSSTFYFEFQKSGSFHFAFGTYKQTSDSIMLIMDSKATFGKIREFNSNKKEFLWDYVPMNYFNDLQFIINQELMYIKKSENNWKTLKLSK